MKHANSVAHNAAWLIAQPFLVGIISIVVTAWIARYLGAADYGTLLLFLSFSSLFSQISSLGLRTYSVREIAINRRRGVEIVSAMLALRSLLAVPAMMIAGLCAVTFAPTLSGILIAALFVQILIGALIGCFADGLQGGEYMKEVATSFAVSGVLTQLACIAALILHLGLVGIVATYILGALVLLVMLWYQFNRVSGRLKASFLANDLLLHVRLSWVFLLQNVVSAIRGRIDLIVINALMGTLAAGTYGSAMVLIQRLDLIQDGIATALFSRAAYLHDRASGELTELVRGAIKVVLVISTPMAVGLLAVSSDVVALMFGHQFIESGSLLAVLGIALPFTFVGGVMFNVLRAMQLEKFVFRVTVYTTMLTICSLVVGIFQFGVHGAAYSFVAGSMALTVALVLEFARRAGVPWLYRDLGRILIANTAMGIALWLVRDLHLATKIVVAVFVYVCSARLLGLVTLKMIKAMFAARTPA